MVLAGLIFAFSINLSAANDAGPFLNWCARSFAELTGRAGKTGPQETDPSRLARLQAEEVPTPSGSLLPSPSVLAIEKFRLSDVLSINAENLGDLVRLSSEIAPGNRNFAVFRGTLQNASIFLKVSHIKEDKAPYLGITFDQFVREVAWTRLLSDLQIGPTFFGISITREGRYAIVTEFVDGVHLSLPNILPLRFPFLPTQSMAGNLAKIRDTLESQGIDAADLQLRVNEVRAFVVDPEFFRAARTLGEVNATKFKIDDLLAQVEREKNRSRYPTGRR